MAPTDLQRAQDAARGALLAAHAASGLAASASASEATRLVRAAEGLLRASVAVLGRTAVPVAAPPAVPPTVSRPRRRRPRGKRRTVGLAGQPMQGVVGAEAGGDAVIPADVASADLGGGGVGVALGGVAGFGVVAGAVGSGNAEALTLNREPAQGLVAAGGPGVGVVASIPPGVAPTAAPCWFAGDVADTDMSSGGGLKRSIVGEPILPTPGTASSSVADVGILALGGSHRPVSTTSSPDGPSCGGIASVASPEILEALAQLDGASGVLTPDQVQEVRGRLLSRGFTSLHGRSPDVQKS